MLVWLFVVLSEARGSVGTAAIKENPALSVKVRNGRTFAEDKEKGSVRGGSLPEMQRMNRLGSMTISYSAYRALNAA